MTTRNSSPAPRTSPGQRCVDAAVVGLALAVIAAGRALDAARTAADTAAALAALARRR